MEHHIGMSAENGLEWQIILTENETVIVRRPSAAPASPKSSLPVHEAAPAPVGSSVKSATPIHPRIYANMR